MPAGTLALQSMVQTQTLPSFRNRGSDIRNPPAAPTNPPCRQMSCRFALCCQHRTAAITEAAQPARPEKHHSDNMSSSSHMALKHKIHKNKA